MENEFCCNQNSSNNSGCGFLSGLFGGGNCCIIIVLIVIVLLCCCSGNSSNNCPCNC